MYKITFKVNSITHEATARRFTAKRHKWYLITLHNGQDVIMAPAEGAWVQEQIPGEPLQPKEFIQAIGSGLEAAGLLF